MAEWLKHCAAVPVLRIGTRVCLPCCSTGSSGKEMKAHKPHCKFHKFKLKPHIRYFRGFFMTLELIQKTQVLVPYFNTFIRIKSTQDEKVRFIKGNELKVTHVHLLHSFLLFSTYIRRKYWIRENFRLHVLMDLCVL